MADTTEHVVAPDAPKLSERQAMASALIEIAIKDDDGDDVLGYQQGDTVGRYTLVKVLGRGGFGVVWEADQTEPITRAVALKIILPGMDSKAVIGRFHAERQALARMSHPNIATVLDAGTTEDSLPYFVMELVRGEPITDYARTWNLDVRERIAVFIDVCSAVQHAHQRAILHRDLKPSNLLVTRVDDKPVPKVIDFGIAKALTEDAGDMPSLVFTVHGQMIGTPQYMAPEHALLGSDQVDVRADVFSLGAILYELLTGGPYLDKADTRSKSAKDVFQRVCNEEPVVPSTRVRQLSRASSPTTAPAPDLDRELDWIVLKALEKAPDERYASVDALSADLQRYLRDEPLSVGAPTAWYRLRKLKRRHHAAFLLGEVVVASLLIVTGVSFYAYQREARQRMAAVEMRQRAEISEKQAVTESRKSAQLVDFLSELLKQAGDQVKRGKNPEALRFAIDESTRQIERFEGQPDLQATLCSSLASVFESMGDLPRALPLWERQWQIYVRQQGPDHYQTLEVRFRMAVAESTTDTAKSTAAVEDICRKLEAQRMAASPLWFEARKRLALNLIALKRGPDAIAIARDLMGRRNGRGEPALEKVSFLKALGKLQLEAGDLDGAEQTYRLGLDRLPDETNSVTLMHDRASLLQQVSRVDGARKRYDLAIQHLEEAIDTDKKAKGRYNVAVVKMLIELSRHYGKVHQDQQADQVTSEALSIASAIGDIGEQIHANRACAEIREQGGRGDQALVFRRDCEALSKDHASDRSVWMEDLRTLTKLLTCLNKHAEAETRANELWKLMQANPQVVSEKENFSRDFYHTLIHTCQEWQKTTGSHVHDADIALWHERLEALKDDAPPAPEKRAVQVPAVDTLN